MNASLLLVSVQREYKVDITRMRLPQQAWFPGISVKRRDRFGGLFRVDVAGRNRGRLMELDTNRLEQSRWRGGRCASQRSLRHPGLQPRPESPRASFFISLLFCLLREKVNLIPVA
jgi:hypothetical protein